MENLLAQKIQDRLTALGKNPSGVALEAGLSRSSVRDILSGKAKHSRIDTLQKLTGPLECTLEFLTGQSDDPNGAAARHDRWDIDIYPSDDIAILEAGVFRAGPSTMRMSSRTGMEYKDHRLPDRSVSLYEMGDDSMADLSIRAGDILTAIVVYGEGLFPLLPGTLVVVHHKIKTLDLSEHSVRQVSLVEGDIHLVCRARNAPAPILIEPRFDESSSDVMGNWFTTPEGGSVTVVGFVVRVEREIEFPQGLREISF